MFIDKARIYVHAGKGGNGCLSFRREKYVPHGGPDGGTGGKGGDIIFRVSPSLKTLYDFQCRSHYSSANGTPGQGGNKAGRNGKDLVLYVPPGTVVFRNGKILTDLITPGEEIIVAQGGCGGRGNTAFKSSKNRAPRIAEKGEPGEEAVIDLELKLIADVGIVGYPNAGKSTFLSKVTQARPKIADYPFTTLTPNLGVLKSKNKEIIFADIPGLIEGAHFGKGLGRDFLRHIERTKAILHLIDIFGYQGKSAKEIFFLLNRELELYNPELLKRPMLIGLNKIDLPEANPDGYLRGKSFSFGKKKYPVFLLSALTGEGTKEICLEILKILNSLPAEVKKEETRGNYVFLPDFEVCTSSRKEKGNIFQVSGKKVERLVAMTDFSQKEAVKRLQNIFSKMGLDKVLEKKGINEGDTVKIGEWEFIWQKG
ncbi:MAG TPA: GTPase ObgE [Elusimicrobia bacterium]|jgi:GTP-binding protein|nr:GTPase ObgE [Elusimicrobiota bacterium]